METDDFNSSNNVAEEVEKTIRCNTRKQGALSRRHDSRKSNRIMSYIIPPFVVLIAIFSIYVWFDMCIQWYLRNGHRTTGACLLAFQILLMICVAASFFQILLTEAGYLPNRADRARLATRGAGEGSANLIESTGTQNDSVYKTYDRPPSERAVRDFMLKPRLIDVPIYIARPDTSDAPRYCSICDVDKYDRVHHCSEVNRCIKKFDHFCPWVGGPIGHTRYKFFFQFISYLAVYCVYITVTLAVAVAQRRGAVRDATNTQHIPANPGLWYVCIGLGAFFAAMMVPFSIFHGRQIALNKTTIEYVETRGASVVVSVRIMAENGRSYVTKERINVDPDTHPFDLGAWQNWQQVLGLVVFDRWLPVYIFNWLLPIRGR